MLDLNVFYNDISKLLEEADSPHLSEFQRMAFEEKKEPKEIYSWLQEKRELNELPEAIDPILNVYLLFSSLGG